ncbi:MAG: 30S ribosomal protein S18 [Candidatus Pacebacteria bacterium]|jgi:small subunit ribosomal protein S18|nr:30S ribosomal protein S18 [Candidatus Paceibacterota bacterium]
MRHCFFKQNNIKHIDYKDVDVLRQFIDPYGRIMSSKRTGVSSKNQRKLAEAIKRARIIGLLPFIQA